MKRARGAEALSREQLEAGEFGSDAEQDQNNNSGMNKASTQVLGQRKIVKVKRHIQETGEVKTNVPDKPAQFKLVGSLSSGAQTTATATKPSFQFNAAPTNNGGLFTAKAGAESNGVAGGTTATESKNLFDGQKKFAVASGGTFGGVKVGEINKKQATGSLFGGQNAAGQQPLFKPAQGGEFGGKKLPVSDAPKEENNKAPTNSIFGGIKPTPGGSLFGNLNTVKSDDKQQATTGGLFGGGTQNAQSADGGSQKFGLFFKTKSESEKKSDEQQQQKPEQKPLFATGSLFGGAGGNAQPSAPAAAGSIFANKPPAGGSLFGQPTTLKPGQSLFGGANSGTGLFNFTAGQASGDKKDEGADNDDDDEEQQGEKSPPIYADTTKVEFKGAGAQNIQPSPYTKVFEKHVNTFKVVKPEDRCRKITNCEVSLEFAETNQKKVFLVVVRQAKKVLMQSTINAKQSRSRRVEEKSAKNQLKVCVQQIIDVPKPQPEGAQATTTASKETQKKMIFPYCVINFTRQEEMINFETEFNKAINELKASQ